MSRDKKVAACPRCCPEGGACFTRKYDLETDRPVWRCNNCHFQKPIKVLAKLDKPTPGQQRIIDRLSDAFGGTVEVEMMGRRAWVRLKNDERKFYDGQLAYGSVHANGTFTLEIPRGYADTDAKVSDWIGVNVYFTRYNPAKRGEVEREDRYLREFIERIDRVLEPTEVTS